MDSDSFAPLKGKFEVRDLGKAHNAIICNTCGQVWKYPRDRELSGAASLALLNHAAGHEETNAGSDDCPQPPLEDR